MREEGWGPGSRREALAHHEGAEDSRFGRRVSLGGVGIWLLPCVSAVEGAGEDERLGVGGGGKRVGRGGGVLRCFGFVASAVVRASYTVAPPHTK